MEEQEYFELQHLLTKLKIVVLKELSIKPIDYTYRNKLVKIRKSVDWLRNNMLIELENKEVNNEKIH